MQDQALKLKISLTDDLLNEGTNEVSLNFPFTKIISPNTSKIETKTLTRNICTSLYPKITTKTCIDNRKNFEIIEIRDPISYLSYPLKMEINSCSTCLNANTILPS